MVTGLNSHMTIRRDSGFVLDLELVARAGTTTALLGPNGAGKSTVVSALAGLLPIDEGRITLNGAVLDEPRVDIFVPPEKRQIGVVFQDYLLFPHVNVTDNVAFGLLNRGTGRHDAVVIAQDWLSRLGLSGLGQRRPNDLSGGQAQSVALARAMATEPEMLLLDEPLAALDVTTRAEHRRQLAEHLAAFEGPRILITHDPAEALLLADEIYVVEAGTVTQSGTTDDLLLRPKTRYAADLAGSNLIVGIARDGAVDAGTWTVHIADRAVDGPVLITIHPTAISLHSRPPTGSPRNTWQTTVESFERLGFRVRLRTGDPIPLIVEVTQEAMDELDIHIGTRIWIAVKATEIGVEPDV